VAYKPKKSKKIIIFEEQQIASIITKLEVPFSGADQNVSGSLEGAFNREGNTCTVVLNDPFLDGVVWRALRDVDRAASMSNVASLEGVLLPQCKEGESPETTKCAKYSFLDDPATGDVYNNEPILIITLWYTLEGINETNSITLYYKVVGIRATHGAGSEPQVTLNGRSVYEVIFQENVNPKFFEKDAVLVDELNKKVFNPQGFKVEDVCATPADEIKNERTYRVNGLTSKEMINKFLSETEDSQVLNLPTKEFGNNIQICSKGDNSCYGSRVFYLGKGLYNRYKISSEIPSSGVEANISQATVAPSLPGEAKTGDKREYQLSVGMDEKTTKEKLSKVSPQAFVKPANLFKNLEDYGTGDVQNGWKGSGRGDSFSLEKIEKKKLFGSVGVSNSFLGGEVFEAKETSIKIRTAYYIHLCNESRKCFRLNVHEEYRKLKSVSVKEKDIIEPGGSIGEANTEDPQESTEFRYFANAKSEGIIVLDPGSLKDAMTVSEKGSIDNIEGAPTNNSADGIFVGNVGSTGKSEGPHLHAELGPFTKPGGRGQPLTAADVDPYVRIGGLPASKWGGVYSPYGPRRSGFHYGIDISGPGPGGKSINGQPITIGGGATIVESGSDGGYGNKVIIKRPDGRELLLAHLQNDSIPADLPKNSTGTFSNTGKPQGGGPGTAGVAKDGVKLETEFKGVPKSLEILPGRTVLSFISNYDSWIENNKSNAVDPGVWIPELYKNWMVTGTTFNWDNGDLKVKLSCNRKWNVSRDTFLNNIPSFAQYNSDGKYSNYYDYIRSSGDLCYTTAGGKNSCAEFCKKKESSSSTGGGSGSPDVTTSYPQGKFIYTCNQYDSGKVQALLDAGSALGVTNKAGLAGIVSGALQESTSALDPTIISGVKDESSQGIFQWNPAVGRLQDLKKWASDNGFNYLDFNTQVNYFVYDVKRGYPNLVPALNSATTPFGAANAFDVNYTISGDRDKGPNWPQNQSRTAFVNNILECMTES